MRHLLVFALVLVAGCGSRQEDTTTPDPAPVETAPTETPPVQQATEGRVVVGTDPCGVDADCVPDGCCHPAACVAVGHAQACGDVMCTTDCRFDTLDCGGACFCQAGHCAARLSAPPVLPETIQ